MNKQHKSRLSLLLRCSWAVWRGRSSPSGRRSLWRRSAPPDPLAPSSCTVWHSGEKPEAGESTQIVSTKDKSIVSRLVFVVVVVKPLQQRVLKCKKKNNSVNQIFTSFSSPFLLTWSCLWGLMLQASAALESRSLLPDWEKKNVSHIVVISLSDEIQSWKH